MNDSCYHPTLKLESLYLRSNELSAKLSAKLSIDHPPTRAIMHPSKSPKARAAN